MGANGQQTVGLPMYDPPELHSTVDSWWRGIARALREQGIAEVPDRLERSLALDALWGAPDLLLTQTCGYPLVTSLVDARHWWRRSGDARRLTIEYCKYLAILARESVSGIGAKPHETPSAKAGAKGTKP